MQDLGPDMDELLRRAAEAYHLNEGESKWDAVESRISGNASDADPKKSGKKFHALLFFFLACGIFVAIKTADYSVKLVREESSTAPAQQQRVFLPSPDPSNKISPDIAEGVNAAA